MAKHCLITWAEEILAALGDEPETPNLVGARRLFLKKTNARWFLWASSAEAAGERLAREIATEARHYAESDDSSDWGRFCRHWIAIQGNGLPGCDWDREISSHADFGRSAGARFIAALLAEYDAWQQKYIA